MMSSFEENKDRLRNTGSGLLSKCKRSSISLLRVNIKDPAASGLLDMTKTSELASGSLHYFDGDKTPSSERVFPTGNLDSVRKWCPFLRRIEDSDSLGY